MNHISKFIKNNNLEMFGQIELEVIENGLLYNFDIEDKKQYELYILQWIYKVFSKCNPQIFINRKTILSVYLHAYLLHTPEPNPLCNSAYKLMTKRCVKDTDGIVISKSTVFDIITITNDIKEYLNSIGCL